MSNTFGGGTANMEFEVLTGMSPVLFSPQLTTPFQMLVPRHPSFPSAARYFTEQGHASMAVHPFVGSMFRRSEAYPRLGFDQFLDISEMDGLSQLGRSGFASDESTFRQVLGLLESSTTPLFMNLVTMQNHFPYDGLYDDPIENNLDSDDLGHYARGVALADDATKMLLDELQASPETTLVIFYGDHLPGIYGEDVVGFNSSQRMREVPFFVWSNHIELPATRFPDTSAMYFLPLALDAAGAKLPPYYALLLDLHAEVPLLNTLIPIDTAALSPQARQLIHDLRLIQYDFSVGDHHVVDEMFHSMP